MFKLPTYIAPDFNEAKFLNSPDASTAPVAVDGIAPDFYHSTSMYPEYFKIDGTWTLLPQTRMDCVAVIDADGALEAKEFRRLKVGETVVTGRVSDGTQGIYIYDKGFKAASCSRDAFSFRCGRSRETSFDPDYKALVDVLKYDKDHGHIVWVLGPAVIFNDQSRKAMEYIVRNGYAHVVFGGNAVATHDLEGALFGTALGQDICTREAVHNGHYNHLDTINMVNKVGSIAKAVE